MISFYYRFTILWFITNFINSKAIIFFYFNNNNFGLKKDFNFLIFIDRVKLSIKDTLKRYQTYLFKDKPIKLIVEIKVVHLLVTFTKNHTQLKYKI
jgi:hypothetical protein